MASPIEAKMSSAGPVGEVQTVASAASIQPAGVHIEPTTADGSSHVLSPKDIPGASAAAKIGRGETATKASELVRRARLIHTIAPDFSASSLADFNKPSFEEFESIVTSLRAAQPPIWGEELLEVFAALEAQLPNIGPEGSPNRVAGTELLMESLEGLGHGWNQVSTSDSHQQRHMDESRFDLVNFVLGAAFFVSADNADKVSHSDRLFAVLDRIETPQVKSRIDTMPFVQAYLSPSDNVTAVRFNRILDAIVMRLDATTDEAKLQHVHDLVPILMQSGFQAGSRDQVTACFDKLCEIARSINGDKAKTEALSLLLEAKAWLPYGTSRDTELAAIIKTVGNAGMRAKLESFENDM